MFKEIEYEIMSIISKDPIQKIAHMPSPEIAKTMELIYNISYENITKVYLEPMNGNITRMTVVYNSDGHGKNGIFKDLCPIKGILHHITFFPSELLDLEKNISKDVIKSIVEYVAARVGLISCEYDTIMSKTANNLMTGIIIQSIPIITCAVAKQLYEGASLSRTVYESLCDAMNSYSQIYSEEGIDSIFNLFDEGLGVLELLDDGFICSITPEDKMYPGIWRSTKKESDEE